MKRRVNTDLIDQWAAKTGDLATEKLCVEASLSHATVAKVRRGVFPERESTRKLLANALNVSEAELFPLVKEKVKAS